MRSAKPGNHLNTGFTVKCYLRQNSSLTANETEIVIGDGISKIIAANSTAYSGTPIQRSSKTSNGIKIQEVKKINKP